MSYKDLLQEQNNEMRERFELAMERIKSIPDEETVSSPYREYFRFVSGFILQIDKILSNVYDDRLRDYSLSELQVLNQELYGDIKDEAYEKSYANPAFAHMELGSDYGKLLAFLYTEIRGMIVYAYEYRLFDITILLELFIEIYNLFEQEEQPSVKEIQSAVYYYVSDYSDLTVEYRVREMLDSGLNFASNIIMNSDLTDLGYLYRYGEYVGDNELEMAAFLNRLPQDEIDKIALTFTEGFQRGFTLKNLDLSKKALLNIRFRVGTERIMKSVITQFRKLNIEPTLVRAAVNIINKRQHHKVGYHSTSPNLQYDYDHRYDDAIYMDKAFCDRKVSCSRAAYEKYKKEASVFAGPAGFSTFGEKPFVPVSKPEVYSYSEKQQKIARDMQMQSAIMTNEYLKQEEMSFSLIAFPIPEIGPDFEEIFEETVKVNTLNNEKYEEIQQKIIDVLDQGEYVHILGMGDNHTDLKVGLKKIEHPEKETNFENCLADVNIPLGEVFTSPALENTNGVLHVTKVYLTGLEYRNLQLNFENGMIREYSCSNFETQEENQRFIKENVFANHESLPLGEFAIGTNTTAYVMGKKYGINNKLPILIAEKTGPHFAVGDTCYTMSEDVRVYNPNGKEITAKDNSVSCLRKEDVSKAYFNCHTDITIPYDELLEISVTTHAGKRISIIEKGKFVLAGTEELNEPFKDI